MRNLSVTSAKACECSELSKCYLFSIDVDTNTLYGASSENVYSFNHDNSMQVVESASLKDDDFVNDHSSIVAIQYVADQSLLCVAISNGELVLWNHNSTPSLESVGLVDGGILHMCWSHDLELLVLVTGNKSVILMTRDYEVICENSLDTFQFGEAELVSVGWGKKETQFYGSEGKVSATKKPDTATPLLCWDDGKPRISWRADNQYFVVHVVDANTNSRKFTVWTRDGQLHSTCSPTSGLAQAVCFRAQRNLIATSVYKQNEHKIVFFEKNGLQHGEFTLCLPNEHSKVLQLSWNLDSSVLAVHCEIEQETLASQVQLWTTSNYHWYMKQCLEFPKDVKIRSVFWDYESSLKLHIITSDGRYHAYTWTYSVDKNSVSSGENDCTVAVIDGTNVLVTPFAHCIVPPPMSAYKLCLSNPVHAVLFGPEGLVNDILVICNDLFLAWFSHSNEAPEIDVSKSFTDITVSPDAIGGNGFKSQLPLPHFKAGARFSGDEKLSPISLHHCIWIDRHLLVACDSSSKIELIKVFEISWKDGSVSERKQVEIPEGRRIVAVDFNSALKLSLFELDDGSCYKFDPAEASLTAWFDNHGAQISFDRVCFQVSLISYKSREIILGLTEQFRFFVNNEEAAQDCTSYAVHKDFILITTHSHTLKCLHLQSCLEGNISFSNCDGTRALERGSKLLGTVAGDTKVVMQMPRGNLEVIHPRLLLLEAIKECLNSGLYRKAFELCRKHRVNMNILVDHDRLSFLKQVPMIVKQLDTQHNINLLLTDLQEEDITKTVYATTRNYETLSEASNEFSVSKVDSVCQAFHDEMKRIDPINYLHSILMTFLKRNPPNIEGALLQIKNLKAKNIPSQAIINALKFLMYMVDVNELFDVALGTYDLDLTVSVAEMSNKDPKEYLPYLNELKAMSEDLRKYAVDMKLKKYNRALYHISRCGDEYFSDCVKLIVEQKLYCEAFDLYPADSKQYKEIALLYADYLSEQKKFYESGMMYFKAEDFHKSLVMFEESRNWRLALCSASKLKFNQMEIIQLAKRLAAQLIDDHSYGDAAYLLEVYVNDYEEAVIALISGHLWEEALRIIYKNNRMDLLESSFKTEMLTSVENYLDQLKKTQEEFVMHRERLKEVRRLKLVLETDLMNGGNETTNCDLYSDTTSLADGESVASTVDSKHSRKSGKSAKSRQKVGKKWSLRKGGPTEEFALLEVLHSLASRVHNQKSDVGQLLRMLVLFSYENQAKDLKVKFEEVIKVIDLSIPLIWQSVPCSLPADAQAYGSGSTSNSIVQSRNNSNSNITNSHRVNISVLTSPPQFDRNDMKWNLCLITSSHQ